MVVYSRNPIDFWRGWLTEKEYINKVIDGFDVVNAFVPVVAYVAFRDAGMKLALKVGWEGDIRGEVMVSALPPLDTGSDDDVMVAWKQDNNGQTFIVSPFRLPWLETDPDEWIES